MNRPVVSIIGRPNVGKSTLFNKLVGKKVSITEDTPGVTRDRLYHEVEWQGNFFLLMDTGGLEIGSNDKISKEIEVQVEIGIDTSDMILFLVDAKQGLTAIDRDIAVKLRKTNKPVILVVNKVDTHHTPSDVYEFYELGIDQMQIISAEQSYGLGDLLDEIVENFPSTYSLEEDDTVLKIAIIGKPNVGKSSLVNKLLGEERMIVSDIPGTTRDAIDSLYQRDGKDYLLIDTAGLRRKSKIEDMVEKYSTIRTFRAVDRADICIFMIDATVGVTEQDTKIAGYAHDNKKASIIVVNKWDLIEKDNKTVKDFENSIRLKFAFMPYAPIVFVSVKTGQRLENIFEKIDEINENYSRRISTGNLNGIIREAMLITPPPTKKGRRLKIYYLSQVTRRPPKFLIYCNDTELLHFSYIRFLENQIRNNFDYEGVPIEFEARNRKV